MDRLNWKETATDFFKKYRLTALILVLGLLLLLLPEKQTQPSLPEESPRNVSLEESLAAMLCRLEGAGKVQVLLTESAGAETLYQTDADISLTDSGRDSRETTVRITGADRADTGLVRQVNPPEYQGALVLCQGADQAQVRLAIVEAVMSVTGLRSDRITVLKMK